MTDRDKLIEAMARAFDVSPFFAGVGLRRLEAQGLAVVPVEPTEAMLEAGDTGLSNAGVDDSTTDDALHCYTAMIQAAQNKETEE